MYSRLFTRAGQGQGRRDQQRGARQGGDNDDDDNDDDNDDDDDEELAKVGNVVRVRSNKSWSRRFLLILPRRFLVINRLVQNKSMDSQENFH